METLDQLRQYLRDNGYSPFITSDEPHCVAVLDWRLDRIASQWRIGYFERGQLTKALIETADESEAVHRFLQTVSAEIYHLKTFKDADEVGKLETALQKAGVAYQRNDVPYEKLLRVFVLGPDLRKAQNVVANT